MAIEIVDLPSWKMVDLSIANCKRLPEGNHHFDAAKMGLQNRHAKMIYPSNVGQGYESSIKNAVCGIPNSKVA
jgi:hypothetical protein